jgi:hypothetical protein
MSTSDAAASLFGGDGPTIDPFSPTALDEEHSQEAESANAAASSLFSGDAATLDPFSELGSEQSIAGRESVTAAVAYDIFPQQPSTTGTSQGASSEAQPFGVHAGVTYQGSYLQSQTSVSEFGQTYGTPGVNSMTGAGCGHTDSTVTSDVHFSLYSDKL